MHQKLSTCLFYMHHTHGKLKQKSRVPSGWEALHRIVCFACLVVWLGLVSSSGWVVGCVGDLFINAVLIKNDADSEMKMS